MLGGATLIFLLVMGLLLLAFARPGIGAGVPAKRWLVHGGLVFPSVTLTALLAFALLTGERLLAHPGAPDLYRVEARPQQWHWEFGYPDAATPAARSIDVLHLPAGRPIDVHVVGTDVIHSFWIPRLGGKIDAIPGHVNVIRLTAPVAGTYQGVCSEYCGTGHAEMFFRVEAHEADDFDAALAEALRAGPVGEKEAR